MEGRQRDSPLRHAGLRARADRNRAVAGHAAARACGQVADRRDGAAQAELGGEVTAQKRPAAGSIVWMVQLESRNAVGVDGSSTTMATGSGRRERVLALLGRLAPPVRRGSPPRRRWPNRPRCPSPPAWSRCRMGNVGAGATRVARGPPAPHLDRETALTEIFDGAAIIQRSFRPEI